MNRHTRAPIALAACAALSVALAGCGLFSNSPTPPPTPATNPSGGTSISTETATPSPIPQLVKSVTLVARIGTPKDWTPAGLTWKGIQTAAATAGAKSALVQPVSNLELAKDIDKAAVDGAIVVTVGPDAAAAMKAAAAAHPEAQFIEVGVAVPASSLNLHGIVFDQAEAGYLAGYVAASLATSHKIGFVGDSNTDADSTSYAAGLKAGATQANPAVVAAVAYAGTPDSPDKGRSAAAGLVKAGDTVIVAPPSLSGIGAEREACARHASIVALDVDAWQAVPDIRSCVIATVSSRYDVAVSAAIATIASGDLLARITTSDVATGGIGLSDFHVALPAGFQAKLDEVIAAIRNGVP